MLKKAPEIDSGSVTSPIRQYKKPISIAPYYRELVMHQKEKIPSKTSKIDRLRLFNAGPKQAVMDQTTALVGPKKAVAGVGLFVACLKKAVVGPPESITGGKNIPAVAQTRDAGHFSIKTRGKHKA